MRLLRVRAALTLSLVALAPGCVPATTDATPGLINLGGAWSYAGYRSGQSVATSGTLTLSQDGSARFNGTFDASEQDVLGDVHRIVGVVSGRTIDTTSVDFDIIVDPTLTRHHTGAVRGDSLSGSWVELSDHGIVGSGSFRARRIRSP